MSPAITGSPFKGLEPFEDSDVDALLFFGRACETETIAANLEAARLTVLFGPTGVGKTSVLHAGVAHRLRAEGVSVDILDSWAGDAVGALRSVVDAPRQGELYLILDQFEEYFVHHGDDDAFAAELADVLARADVRVNVLVGIREDSLARLDAFTRQLPRLLGNRLRIERLDRRAAEEAIRGPIDAFNETVDIPEQVKVEPELVEAVLDEVAVGRVQLGASGRGAVENGRTADRIEAPFLQLVLERLWEAEREEGSRRLRLATFRRLGGASSIVRDHLERAMASLTEAEQEAAAAMYHHLVTPSGTKIAHGVGDLAGYASVDEAAAAALLGKLARDRIVRASFENGTSTTRYEIFHDVLADAVLGWRVRHEEARALLRAEQRHRRARVVATAALIGLILVGGIAVFALIERGRARTEARHARARALAAQADSELEVDPNRSLALGVRAASQEATPNVEAVLRNALLASHVRTVLTAPQPQIVRGPRWSVVGDARGRLRWVRPDGAVIQAATLDGPITSLSVGPGGSVAVGMRDGRIVVVGAGGRKASFRTDGQVTAVALGPFLAAGSGKGTVSLWRTPRKPTLFHVRGPVTSLAFSPDRRLILVTSRDRRARLADARTGRVIHTLSQAGFIYAASFSPDSRLVVTGSADRTARIWSARTGRVLHSLDDATGAPTAIAFSSDGKLVAIANGDGVARVYDARSGVRLYVLSGDTNAITDVGFSPDRLHLVTASADRTARVWTTDIGRQVAILRGHGDTVTKAFFLPDSDHVVTASVDGTVRIWDAGVTEELRPLISQRTPFVRAVRHADGIAVVDASGTLRLLDPRARRVVRVVRGRPPGARLATAAEGDLAARAAGNTITLARGGRLVRRIGAVGVVASLAFSPDGRLLAAGGRDGYLRVWNVATGRRLVALRAHQGPVEDAQFSPDGRWIVTAGPISAGVWAAETGRQLLLLHGPTKPLRAALFTQDGRRIVVAGDDGTIRAYDCVVCGTVHELVRAAEARLAQARPH